jgi:outer membrane protein assembly factor BamB
VGAPLVFEADRVVINTTGGEGYILRNMARGPATIARALAIGGRMSFSPVPLGANGFILASDARWTEQLGTHGYMMAYSLPYGSMREFTPLWLNAVVTPAGLPGEAAVDTGVLYTADKYGRLYALRHGTGELLWCRQYENRTLVNCYDGGPEQPGFINNGPGVDEERVYFVFRNSQGPARGNGIVFALNKATGQIVWQQSMPAWGNTAPVPMGCGKPTSIGRDDGWQYHSAAPAPSTRTRSPSTFAGPPTTRATAPPSTCRWRAAGTTPSRRAGILRKT